jgi:zinc/manganese transport system substrate-binding protein
MGADRRRGARSGAVLLAIAVLTAACASEGDEGRLSIVVTTTPLGDVVRNVVGDDGGVTVLLPIGADPHIFQPSSQQVAMLQEADLVVANGLGLEEGMADILERAEADGANVLQVAPLLDPIPFAEHSAGESGADLDPHVWMDPIRMGDAARLIAAELAGIDPTVDWAGRAEVHAADLAAADAEIAAILAAVPEAQRQLVTNHDAFGYFAARYDFDVIGVVIPGGSTVAEPSSAELAELVEVIQREGVPAIFAETTEPTALAEAVADEVGSQVEVVELYSGSLGEPGSGADTLTGMLTGNARLIADALS